MDPKTVLGVGKPASGTQMTTFESGGNKISVELFLPPTPGLHPAVVVAYGTEGMGTLLGRDVGAAIRDFAGYLATKGFVTLIPHFFERTNTHEGFQTVIPAYDAAHRDEWVGTLGDCLEFAAGQTTKVDKNRLGLLGFSLGGHLSLRQAKAGTAAVRAVVDFYAPISQLPFNGLGDRLEALPPVQIHHGTADQIVPKTESDELERLLVSAGKRKGADYERHEYIGEGHGFRETTSIKLSKERTSDFLNRFLH
jgi:dienelactone hydrolase